MILDIGVGGVGPRTQEKSRQAVQTNSLFRARSRQLVEQGDSTGGGGQLVSVNNDSNLASLADEHYAISASKLDAARERHNGNWIKANCQAFQKEHRQILSHDGPEDNENEIEQSHCQCVLGPGLCQKQIEPEKPEAKLYHSLMGQAKNALRLARAVRRSKGHVSNHVPLLLIQAETEEQLGIYLMVRLSFSPLDATVITLRRTSEQRACLCLVDGMPAFDTLCGCIYKIAQQYAGVGNAEQEHVRFKTSEYKAISLSEIELSQARTLNDDSLAPLEGDGDADGGSSSESGDGGDSSEDGKDMRSRLRMLRQAVGKQTTSRGRGQRGGGKGKGRGRGRARGQDVNPKRKAKEKSRSKPDNVTDDQSIPPAPIEAGEGAAKEAHDAIMSEWEGALESQLGPMPSASASGPSSSSATAEASTSTASATAPTSSATQTAIPIESYTEPWRDQKGYCWVYNVESGKPYNLGRNLNPMLKSISFACFMSSVLFSC